MSSDLAMTTIFVEVRQEAEEGWREQSGLHGIQDLRACEPSSYTSLMVVRSVSIASTMVSVPVCAAH